MWNAITVCAGFVSFLAATSITLSAPPTVDRLFPAGGQRGTTTSVSITGKIDSNTKAWCSCKTAKLTLNSKSRKLQVVLPQNAKPGLHWIRLFNDEGASPPKAFFIGTLPVVIEKEPNDRIDQSQPLPASSVVNGVLAKSNEVDTFAVAMKKGQTLVASMTAHNTLGSPMDGILQVVSSRGFVLEQNDDEHGFDPQLTFTAKSDETVHVRAFAFPAMPNSSVRLSGASSYVYRLTITTGPFVDHVFPLAVPQGEKSPVIFRGWNIPDNKRPSFHPVGYEGIQRRVSHSATTEREPNSLKRPQAVTLPITVSGHIDEPGDRDVIQFAAKKGESLRCRIEARSLRSPLDPVLRLLDANGKAVARAETRSSTKIDETLSYRVPADGKYRLEVTDLHRRGGWRFVYRLTVSTSPLLESLSVAADRFTLSAGKPLVIPVVMSGRGIKLNDVTITVRGLPPGITAVVGSKLTKAKSAGGSTVKITLTTKSGKRFNGPFQIIATEKKKAGVEHLATANVTGTTQRISTLWLTVTKPTAKSGGKKSAKKKP